MLHDRDPGQPGADLACTRTKSPSALPRWAAIIAVPTMVAGIYGMNFEHMPELDWSFGYPLAIAVMVVHRRLALSSASAR